MRRALDPLRGRSSSRQVEEHIDDPVSPSRSSGLASAGPTPFSASTSANSGLRMSGRMASAAASTSPPPQLAFASACRPTCRLCWNHGPRSPPQTPRLPRLASRHAGGRPADRRLLRPRIMPAGTTRRWTGSRRCSRSRTSISWPGRSEPPVPPSAAHGDADASGFENLDYVKRSATEATDLQQDPDAPGRPITLAGVPVGLPALARRRPRARGRAPQRPRRVHRARRSGDARAGRRRALFRARARGDRASRPGTACPTTAPARRCASTSERLATLHALQRKRDEPAAARHHGQRGAPAHADPVPHPRARRPARARRADRPRQPVGAAPAPTAMSAPTPSSTPASSRCAAVSSTSSPSGEDEALRLDFFGDEIESVRRFDPATQRTIGRVEGFTLLPASEALLDEDTIKRFRSALSRTVRRQRDRRSALPGGQRRPPPRRHGALAAAVRGAAGHRCSTISSDERPDRPRCRRDAARPKRGSRRSPTITRTAARPDRPTPGSYRPLAPDTLYLARDEWEAIVAGAAGPPASRPSTSPKAPTVIDFGFDRPARFRARARRGDNVYEAVGRARRRPAPRQAQGRARQLFRRLARAADRACSPSTASTKTALADSWQEALGRRRQGAGRAGPAARSRLRQRRPRAAHRAGHARRPPGPPAQAPQERRRLPRRTRDAHRPATSSSMSITASAATRG